MLCCSTFKIILNLSLILNCDCVVYPDRNLKYRTDSIDTTGVFSKMYRCRDLSKANANILNNSILYDTPACQTVTKYFEKCACRGVELAGAIYIYIVPVVPKCVIAWKIFRTAAPQLGGFFFPFSTNDCFHGSCCHPQTVR